MSERSERSLRANARAMGPLDGVAIKRALFAVAALAIGCNSTTINTPIRTFDRPSDVALTCVLFDPSTANRVWTPLPLEDCNPDTLQNPDVAGALTKPDPLDLTGTTVYMPELRAWVTNSARGELAAVDVQRERIADLSARVPGFGFIPVGSLPEHVRTTHDGCAAITSNTDSCDLSLVDTATALNLPLEAEREALGDAAATTLRIPQSAIDNVTQRLQIRVDLGSGKRRVLSARPSWIELAPESLDAKSGFTKGQPGQCSGGDYSVWVALPGCQIVVDAHVAGGEALVTRAVRVTKGGAEVVSDLTTLSCPDECGSDFGQGVSADLAAPPPVTDGGAARLPQDQEFPAALALDTQATSSGVSARLFIGQSAAESLYVVPISVTRSTDPATGAVSNQQISTGAPRTITLEKGAQGVSVLRVSPRSQAGTFLYAVARDSSVRVVDLDRETECETNPDPRYLQAEPPVDPAPDARRLGCFPLGDPSTPPRSPLVGTPGIVLPNGALPRDVSFIHLDIPPPNPDPQIAPPIAGPTLLVGDFAWIIGSDGRASVVNVHDACPAPNFQLVDPNNPTAPPASFTPACDLTNAAELRRRMSLDPGVVGSAQNTVVSQVTFPGRPSPLELERMAHRLRAANARFLQPQNCGDVNGAPRIADESPGLNETRTIAGQTISENPDGGVDTHPHLVSEVLPPSTLSNACAAATRRSIGVFDPDHIHNETWTLAWEGLIPGTQRTTGAAGKRDASVFTDTGGQWCARGVLAGDELQLNGCKSDSDCDYLQYCARDASAPSTVTTGLCLDRSDPTGKVSDATFQKQLATACTPLLRAVRQYRVLSAKQGVVLDGQTTDALTLGEIYSPSQLDVRCDADPTVCNQVFDEPLDEQGNPLLDPSGQQVKLTTTCLKDADGGKHCLRACTPNATDNTGALTADAMCAPDFQCLPSRFGDNRCMRAPLNEGLFTNCLKELQPYELHSRNAFLVSGSLTGLLSDEVVGPGGECQPATGSPYARLRQARIPVAAQLAACPSANLFDPLPGTFASSLCELPAMDTTRVVHFENPYFAIALGLPGFTLPPGFTLTFQVVGGGLALQTVLAVDATAQSPRAVVTAPDRQTVFVVDEGKATAATGLRGQLLRLSSSTQSIDHTFQVR